MIPIATSRLSLRKPVPGDAQRLFESYTRDPDVCRYMIWRPHSGLEQSEAFIERCIAVWEEEVAFPWVLESRENGRVLGMLEARFEEHAVSLGYVLAKAAWGQGLMNEALAPVLDWSLAQPGIFRVWAVCDVENLRSARVMQKAGMQREGTLRRWLVHPNLSSEPRDCECYSKVR